MSWTISNPVVVPFDFSKHAIQAVERACQLVEASSQIHVLHVLPYLTATEPGVVWATVDDASRIKHALEALREALPESKYGKIFLDVRIGDPGSVAAERAEELEAELLVVGSHGRRGITCMVLGSVAERVVRLAHCPVLVVKLPTEVELETDTKSAQAAIA